MAPVKPLRLLALIEASVITGPAKNLLHFAAHSLSCVPPVEVSVATFRRPGESDVFARAVQQANLPLFEIPESHRFDRSVVPALRAIASAACCDLVQSHAVKSHYLVRSAGLARTIPWIAFHHGYTWPAFRVRLYNHLDRWSLRAARRILTVSISFKQQLTRMGVPAARIEVIHNAIDPDWGAGCRTPEAAGALRRELGIASDARVVLSVGRLSKEKDHLTLLRAFSLFRAAHPQLPAHLLIVGDGPERERILHAVRQLDLAPVTLAGQQPSSEPFYAIADLVALSSLSEGSPNALLEAMAARVPVVATAVGGIPEIVANGASALLAQSRDPSALAASIASVLTDPEKARRLAENAHRVILERHSPQSRARRLCAIYGALVKEGR
jgi:glycosyltransferase involved in cell wall biosynthesis